MRPVLLSERMQAVAAMVTVGSRVCDVGCDHGFVPIYLTTQGISPKVLAMDVKSGPLSAAKQHITERGLEEVVYTRLSDGLHNYNIGEADTLICAGMGGRLMMRILSDDQEKTESFRELILQPQSEIEQLRRWLRMQGYCIADENMIEEDGKFYTMMRIKMNTPLQGAGACDYTGICQGLKRRKTCGYAEAYSELKGICDYNDDTLCKLIDRYGPYLLLYRNSTLTAYLKREGRIYGEILSGLQAQGLSNDKRKSRYAEVAKLLKECRMALEIMTE